MKSRQTCVAKKSSLLQRAAAFAMPEVLESRQLFTAANSSVVDLYMGYTTAAREQVGSTELMVEKINRGVALLNQTLANSKVRVSVRLVGTKETNYTETKVSKTDMARLIDGNDGNMDDVLAAAKAAGADVTDVVFKNLDVGGLTQGTFNLINLAYLDNGVLSHEFGHTLGGDHGHGAGEDGKHALPYAYEGTLKFGDQSYSGAIYGNLNYFSNPNVLFRGVPTGVAGTGPDAADNARAMNDNAAKVSGTSAQLLADSTGPDSAMGPITVANGENAITFKVRYVDGSAVNVDSFGNDDVLVTGPNGFSQLASFVGVDDPSTNYGYVVATYKVNTPGPVGNLADYSFAVQANAVTDTVGNAAAAGKIGGPTSIFPDYAGSDEVHSSEEGDLTGKTWMITDEIGPKYQFGFVDWSYHRFSLSSGSTISVDLPAKTTAGGNLQVALYQDKNGNLAYDEGDRLNPTGVNTWANLPAGDNYYVFFNPWQSGNIPYGQFTATMKATGTPPAQVAPASLTGSVFTDDNNNGTQDNGETGIAGVALTLSGTDDQGKTVNVIATTDAAGVYKFNNLRPSAAGGYTLTESQPPGRPQGTNKVGSLGGTLGTDAISGIVVAAGQNGTGYTFGEGKAPTSAEISGSVFVDTNDDGIRQQGEVGIANVRMILSGTMANGNALDTRDIRTDADGNYTFTNLPASQNFGYNIMEVQPDGVLDGKDTAGSLGGFPTLVKNNVLGITLNGISGTGYYFAEKSLPANPPPPPTTTGGTNTTDQNTTTGGNVATGTTAPAAAYNSGGFNFGTFDGDSFFSFSDEFTTDKVVSTAGVTNAADPQIYKDQRTGSSFFYEPDGLTAGAKYIVRLHFAEIQYTDAGKRVFNVSIEGNQVLTNFDMVKEAGANRAIVKDFEATANASGNIRVNFNGVVDNAVINGLEFIPTLPATPAPSTFAKGGGASLQPSLTVQVLDRPQHAAGFAIHPDGTYCYIPQTDFVGNDSFTYQVVDENGRVAQGTIKIVVKARNQPPKMDQEIEHVYATTQTGIVDIDLLDVMKDGDSPNLSFTLSKIVGGKASLLQDGHTVRFTADANFTGNGEVNFRCSDGKNSVNFKVTVCVGDVVAAPVSKSDASSTLPSTSVAIDVLKNDSDPLDGILQVASVANPAHGTAWIDSKTGKVMYKPDFGFHGSESFNYQLVNGYGKLASGKVTVTVKPGIGVGTDPTNSGLTGLDIFGTSANEKFVLSKSGSKVAVSINGKSAGLFSANGVVLVDAVGGNDTIDASALTQPAWLFGGDGNDSLTGGSKNDLLVGGKGTDSLKGNAGNDVLISGYTDDQSKGLAPLAKIFSTGTLSSGFAHRDSDPDQLRGDAGTDLFVATVTGVGKFDILKDRATGEKVLALT